MKKARKINIVLLLTIVLIISLTGCGPSVSEGNYDGTAAGYHGDISITAEINKDGKITAIIVGGHTETEGIGTIAIEKIPQRIIEAQALDVDAVSGATVTSMGIIDAVAASLIAAGADPSQYAYSSPEKESKDVFSAFDKDEIPVKKQTTGSVTVTDAKGREVKIELPVSTYAVSTMDVVDYMIPLKGKEAFDMLVGSGQDGGGGIQKYAALYQPVVGEYTRHLGQISDHNTPFDLEMILSVNPDVLIVNSAMSAHKYALEVEDQLKGAGIEIVLIDVPGKKLDQSVQQTMKLLGQIFQEEGKAAEVSTFIDTQYGMIHSKNLSQRQNKPTVYYEKSGYSEVYGSTSTSRSGWGACISIAGAENIADPLLLEGAAAGGNSNTLDPEYVIEADPDYIIVSGINDGWLDKLSEKKDYKFDILSRTGWNELKAVKNRDLYEFAHSTSRSIYAFYPSLKMAKIFYPEEFKDVDPDAVLDEFFDRFMLLDSDISTWFISMEDAAA